MNGTKLLIDTNIALYFLGGDQLLGEMLDGREVYISAISEMELMGYPKMTPLEYAQISSFLQDCVLVDISSDIKQIAIDIRKRYNLKLPDAIIAATAIQLNLPLVSSDSIFSRITDLFFVQYVR